MFANLVEMDGLKHKARNPAWFRGRHFASFLRAFLYRF